MAALRCCDISFDNNCHNVTGFPGEDFQEVLIGSVVPFFGTYKKATAGSKMALPFLFFRCQVSMAATVHLLNSDKGRHLDKFYDSSYKSLTKWFY